MRSGSPNFLQDERGSAAIELTLIGGIVLAALMNVAEVARYAYQTAELNAAAQAGAEAALVACDVAHTPATINCPGLSSAVTTAIQSTSLGAQVVLNGAIGEGYYCLTPAGALQYVSAANSKPADCSAVKNNQAVPTLYLQVPTKFAYQAIFPGLTIVQTFASPATRIAWMRMA